MAVMDGKVTGHMVGQKEVDSAYEIRLTALKRSAMLLWILYAETLRRTSDPAASAKNICTSTGSAASSHVDNRLQ